jgi:hypothetical protein
MDKWTSLAVIGMFAAFAAMVVFGSQAQTQERISCNQMRTAALAASQPAPTCAK